MKYIDADLLRKEIDKWVETMADAIGDYSDGVRFALEHFTFVLDSLQQEQQEVDLEEEIERFLGSEESTSYTNAGGYVVAFKDTVKIARHFYELGQSQMPMPEDTVLFNKGVAEGRRLEREDMLKDAIHYVVQDDLDSHGASYNIPFIRIGMVALKPKGIGVGDKVQIIVVKDGSK